MEERKTILGKIIAAILSVFAANWESFVSKLWKKVPGELQEKVTLVVRIVENIKGFVDSPGADMLVAVIPGDVDDKLRDWLSKTLGNILTYERLIEIPGPELSSKQLHTVASSLTQELTGLSYGQSALTTEVAYQNFKKDA